MIEGYKGLFYKRLFEKGLFDNGLFDPQSSDLRLHSFPRADMKGFLEFLKEVRDNVTGDVYTTGVGMEQYSEQITECLGKR